MLGKLLKHEWRSTWKIPTILIGLLLILSFFSGLTFASPLWQSEMGGLELLVIMVWLVFYFALIGVSIGITLYMAIHFYRSMFTDEGYLTHTLPVTSHQLLISKIIPMMAWAALSTLGVMASIGIFGGMAILFLMPDRSVLEVIRDGFRFFEEQGLFDMGHAAWGISLLFIGIAGLISDAMIVVGSISIGQMVNKHKVLGSIGAYFAINTVIQVCMSCTSIPFMFNSVNSADHVFEILTSTWWIMGVVSLLVSIGLYFLSEYLIRKKLNLD